MSVNVVLLDVVLEVPCAILILSLFLFLIFQLGDFSLSCLPNY